MWVSLFHRSLSLPRNEIPNRTLFLLTSEFRKSTGLCLRAEATPQLVLGGAVDDITESLVAKVMGEKLEMQEAVEPTHKQWSEFLGRLQEIHRALPLNAKLMSAIDEVEKLCASVLVQDHLAELTKEVEACADKTDIQFDRIFEFWKNIQEDGSVDRLPDSVACRLAGLPLELEGRLLDVLVKPLKEAKPELPQLSTMFSLAKSVQKVERERQKPNKDDVVFF